MTPEIQLLENILREGGHSVTKTRQQIFQAMTGQQPMTMLELVSKIPNVDRSSIYRTVALFESIQIVNRIQMGWKYKLELSDKFNPHHHHVSCISCGKISELPESEKIEEILEKLVSKLRFSSLSHQIEVNGICESCKIKNPELLLEV